ncbi:ABC transporter ATP-binding protein [Umezakia ovalisporum]|uniref:ABC transporter ATP-binding protein/permease n=2 Tax=Umezakia ovalisporum TaxID=75695 RepID=A0AA43GZ97_9CYAN|nr:ABC transporter ATP-binding protein [Umezakia ovalisporum]MDH6056306.1 ABC transporter ATP-binding protein/permease [Umezakia ovalisporum FSS-43]MDH6064314.1 ABC transporter ATP-binding protein/permease [Umezakia ovalisporum FSS-62]MDH6068855.1 ABC transporter ATP-binding protein/permease [Umezakia ovalisporum APH033B]MDH6071015.1 ABC transporter ATP-binding protein/permease [Umezakia ovalisporum CobakiLakeA]MDH6072920.1 ABC transporter ATP-binding protein/permease [Umezakia ovalisporum CS-
MAIAFKSHQASKKLRHSVHPLQRLLDYGHEYRQQIWLATGCSILNKLFDLAPPALIGIAVDVVVKQQDSIIAQFGVKNIFGQFLILSLLTVITWVLESFFEYRYKLLWRNLAQKIQHNLRLDAYKHLQELELVYFEERSTGGLMSILSDDVNQLERFLDVGANDIIHVATTIVIIGGAFFILAPSIAWMAILPMPFILWGSLAFQKLLAPRYADVREKVGLLNGRLSNNLSGMTTIKSFTAEEYEVSRLEKESIAYKQSNSKAIALSAAFIPLIRMLILISFTALLLFGGIEAVAGRISVGTYSVLIFLVQRLLWPLTRLGDTFDLFQRAMASTNRVMNLLDTPITIHPGNIALSVDAAPGEVEFHNVSFAYKDRLPVIENLSLRVPAGKTIAIVGSTGSGKSTLVKLLLRLYEVKLGKITLDGIKLQDLNLRSLRRCIGLVSQDVFLFHGTVAENITYGTFNAKESEIITAAKVAEAHEFITHLPQGYDTIIGERGQKLSGGQRQRIAIARAVLKNPPILILDEATSAVDNETEAAIQRSLERITVDRTTIAIAHRLSTIRNADCIYVMEHGKLIESGTHEQLLDQNGVYANLWRVQSGLR